MSSKVMYEETVGALMSNGWVDTCVSAGGLGGLAGGGGGGGSLSLSGAGGGDMGSNVADVDVRLCGDEKMLDCESFKLKLDLSHALTPVGE